MKNRDWRLFLDEIIWQTIQPDNTVIPAKAGIQRGRVGELAQHA